MKTKFIVKCFIGTFYLHLDNCTGVNRLLYLQFHLTTRKLMISAPALANNNYQVTLLIQYFQLLRIFMREIGRK